MSAAGPGRKAEKSRTDWQTPQLFFDGLNEEFHFTIDAAANSYNTMCEHYISKDRHGGAFEYRDINQVIWCNPSYGKLGDWVDLFISWGKDNTVVALLPNNTDTTWFTKIWATASEVRFVYPRLAFIHPHTKEPADSPAGGNMVAIWRQGEVPSAPKVSRLGIDGRAL